MKCNYNGCSSKCKGDIDADSCNVLRAYQQGKTYGAREFAEWCYINGINFSECSQDDCDNCNRIICTNCQTFVDVVLAEWEKGAENE